MLASWRSTRRVALRTFWRAMALRRAMNARLTAFAIRAESDGEGVVAETLARSDCPCASTEVELRTVEGEIPPPSSRAARAGTSPRVINATFVAPVRSGAGLTCEGSPAAWEAISGSRKSSRVEAVYCLVAERE